MVGTLIRWKVLRMADGNGHYVAHVRLEKVTTGVVTTPGTRGQNPTQKNERNIEELTNVVQKSASFEDLVSIVTQILEISKRATDVS